MAQRSIMSKGTSAFLQSGGLSTFGQSQVPVSSGYVLKEVQRMLNDYETEFTKKIDEVKLQMERKLENTLEDIKDQIKKANQVLLTDLLQVLDALAVNMDVMGAQIKELQGDQKVLQQTVDGLEERMQDCELGVLEMQYKEMENIIRLRGLKESNQENLKNICAEAFSVLLQRDSAEMHEHIVKIYRVNSWVARQKNLPRDVLVHFGEKQIRYDVAQAAYIQGLKIQGQPVRAMKELPIKILKKRKDYIFLTDELKKRGLPFRWEIPVGVVVRYMGQRYRLCSVQKAQEFYYNVLQVADAGTEVEKVSITQLENNGVVIPEALVEEGVQVGDKEMQECKDKRITRTMVKKMKKGQRK